MLPEVSIGVKVLLAIILCNTGMGLLMVVLRELKAPNTTKGRILIGAAVLTEIIIILTFGLVSGFVVRGVASVPHILVNIGIVISFLVVVFLVILKYSERFGNFLTKKGDGGFKHTHCNYFIPYISFYIWIHGIAYRNRRFCCGFIPAKCKKC